MRLFLPKDSPLINALTCCANCNKDVEPFTLKMCLECRLAHYCNDDCQQADRENHQHQCNKDAQMLKEDKEWLEHNHAKENTDNDDDNDDKLFQPIHPKDDCQICFLPLPVESTGEYYFGRAYNPCCGNFICSGCSEEDFRATLERGLKPSCAFCREPSPTSDNEIILRIKKRMEVNDSDAIYKLSYCYKSGEYGLPTDPQKEFELCLRAAELGHPFACIDATRLYAIGVVVTKDMAKARKYRKIAVMKGNIVARHNLGVDEWTNNNNYRVASRHWLISAAAGYTDSLTNIAKLYRGKVVTKDEYSIALTSYMNVHKNEYSIERERAASATR